MPFNYSASNYMKSLLIICSKLAKVTSKQCSGTILISLCLSFYLTNERYDEC